MASPTSRITSVADVGSFIIMLMTACEDRELYGRLESVLTLPDEKRKGELHAWITDLLVAQAPRDLVMALACLLDDAVAEKAYQVIYKCSHGEPLA
jgi:hypothetical protein